MFCRICPRVVFLYFLKLIFMITSGLHQQKSTKNYSSKNYAKLFFNYERKFEKFISNSPLVWLSSLAGWFELLFSLSVFFLPKVNIRLGGVADSIFFEPNAVLGRLPLLITSVLAMSSNETRLPLKYSYLLWFHEKNQANLNPFPVMACAINLKIVKLIQA